MLPSVNFPVKTVNEIRYYGIDWTKRLKPDEYIVSSAWEVSTELEIRERGLSEDYSRITLVKLAGGLARKKYRIINRISTSAGQLLEIAANLEVQTYSGASA